MFDDFTFGGFMAGGENSKHSGCSAIVATVPGQGTGEVLYRTADGRVWRRLDGIVFDGATTAQATGWLHGGYICNHR
jgi:hypothetical protein